MIKTIANLFLSLAVLAAPAVSIEVLTRDASPGTVEITPCIENAADGAVFSYEMEVRKDGASRSRSSQNGTVRVESGEKKCDFVRSKQNIGEGQSIEVVLKVYRQGVLVGEKVRSLPRH